MAKQLNFVAINTHHLELNFVLEMAMTRKIIDDTEKKTYLIISLLDGKEYFEKGMTQTKLLS